MTQDKLLFTPGPLTTSGAVKQAMLRDLGSRDEAFIQTVAGVRRDLLALGGTSQAAGFEAVILQGCGTFGLESVISSAIAYDGKLLAVMNGSYGARIAQLARVHGIEVCQLESPERERPDPAALERMLDAQPEVTHVSLVHCETSSGMLNSIDQVGACLRGRGVRFIVDSMSAFGAVPLDVAGCGIDFLVSSSNKCIEGVPGFSFVLARRAALLECDGRARTLSLDLHAQWKGLEANGQFRFTPPTHAILAFERALVELTEEGGIAGRNARYRCNQRVLIEGMRALGFVEQLPPELLSPIITSFRTPNHPRFRFEDFYAHLSRRGFVIYPGKMSSADCFRIGHIGRLDEADMRALLVGIGQALAQMDVTL